MRIVGIGEVVWDVFDSFEQLGGAPLNFAVQVRRLGNEVDFISAVGKDRRGDEALRLIDRYGLPTNRVPKLDVHPTGCVDVTVTDDGDPSYVIQRPAAYDFPSLTREELGEIASHGAQWIYYGTLQQTSPVAKELTQRLAAKLPSARRFYDMNLRRDSFSAELVRDLLEQASILKLNEDEARTSRELLGGGSGGLEDYCSWVVKEFDLEGVCVTRGPDGCVVRIGDDYRESPGFQVDVEDAVGAGDAFAAGFVHGLGQGWELPRVCEFANRLGALIASKAGALSQWSADELAAISTQRAEG